MNPETIERLAIDSASGQLSEDVEALLREYLAEHPEENKYFLEMQAIYNKTQIAFDSKITFINQPAENKIPIKFNYFPIIRWAAVIVIAACIGVIAGRISKQDVPQQESKLVVASATSTPKTGFNLDDLGEGFWRNKITAMLNPSPERIQREYNSSPSLLEKYRSYLKEKNHE